MRTLYRILSALLSYPEEKLLQALPEIDRALDAFPDARQRLAPLLQRLRDSDDLIELQLDYVAMFDRVPDYSLHLFEHIHGESRDRGAAMLDLLGEYQRRGFEPADNELPDYLPLFLEFLGQLDEAEIALFINDAVHVIAAIGERLERIDTPYAAAFAVLCGLAQVEPQPLSEMPARSMAEMLERYGPASDGSEPLLPRIEAQPVTLHARGAIV